MNKEIAVIIEHTDGIISQQGLDAAAFALSLGSIYGWGVKAFILSDDIDSAEKLTGNLSIDSEILVCRELGKYCAEAYTGVLSAYLEKYPSSYIIIPHSPRGYDYAPALAVELGFPCITAVTGLNDNKGTPVFFRLTAGGRIESQVISRCDKAVITVNPGQAYSETYKTDTREYSVSATEIKISLDKTVNVLLKKSEPRGGELLRAPVVIAAGKGVATEENMSLLREMARLFPGSSIAGSRGACDIGLTDYSLQVGMTGKSIAPKIYIACGISGSPQHMAGLRGAGTIVAINRDPEAPIHRLADISIIEKIEDFIPEFIRAASDR
jgi:electron transfer flavoprotein alpha subunit